MNSWIHNKSDRKADQVSLANIQYHYNKLYHVNMVLVVSFFCVPTLCLLGYFIFSFYSATVPASLLIYIGAFVTGASIFGGICLSVYFKKISRRYLSVVSTCKTKAVLPVLLIELRLASTEESTRIKNEILRLLPDVTAKNCGLIDQASQDRMSCLVESHFSRQPSDDNELDYKLRMALLSALAKVGTYRTAKRLSSWAANLPSRCRRDILVISAKEVTSQIETRLKSENASGVLLRASASAHSPGELLRAADSTYSNTDADAQLLLPTLGQEETPPASTLNTSY